MDNNNTLEYQLSSPDYALIGDYGRYILNYRKKPTPWNRPNFLRARRFFMQLLKYCLSKHSRYAIMSAELRYPGIQVRDASLRLFFKARIPSHDGVSYFYLEFVQPRTQDTVTFTVADGKEAVRFSLLLTKRFMT